MLAFGSGARSQDRGAWDPIRGFADGNVVINDPASTHRPDSPWSQYRAINTDLQGWSDNPGTIGGITITREGRRCGGLFRSGQC